MKSRKSNPQRDASGRFQAKCSNCGASWWSPSNAKPVPNCDQCPGHDDIARRDQEDADSRVRGWYVDFELHKKIGIHYFEGVQEFHEHDGNLHGPHKNFATAKQEALYLARWERDQAEQQIREVKMIRRKDFP